MGSTGPRYFVPPNHDPIAQVIDEGLWNWSAVFGAALARDMTADGLQGVASHWVFDDYWPGSTETSHWKNIISFLTEAASCKTATPVFIEPTELRVSGKGLSEYKKGVNMLDPWPGGTWSLGDIVEYELSSMASILATAAANRDKILTFRNDLCRKEVEKGRTEPPYYFALPKAQSDPGELAALVELLGRVHAWPAEARRDRLPVGAAVVAQEHHLAVVLVEPGDRLVEQAVVILLVVNTPARDTFGRHRPAKLVAGQAVELGRVIAERVEVPHRPAVLGQPHRRDAGDLPEVRAQIIGIGAADRGFLHEFVELLHEEDRLRLGHPVVAAAGKTPVPLVRAAGAAAIVE